MLTEQERRRVHNLREWATPHNDSQEKVAALSLIAIIDRLTKTAEPPPPGFDWHMSADAMRDIQQMERDNMAACATTKDMIVGGPTPATQSSGEDAGAKLAKAMFGVTLTAKAQQAPAALVDREAFMALMSKSEIWRIDNNKTFGEGQEHFFEALLSSGLIKPVPTREQVASVLEKVLGWEDVHNGWHKEYADAVMSLFGLREGR